MYTQQQSPSAYGSKGIKQVHPLQVTDLDLENEDVTRKNFNHLSNLADQVVTLQNEEHDRNGDCLQLTTETDQVMDRKEEKMSEPNANVAKIQECGQRHPFQGADHEVTRKQVSHLSNVASPDETATLQKKQHKRNRDCQQLITTTDEDMDPQEQEMRAPNANSTKIEEIDQIHPFQVLDLDLDNEDVTRNHISHPSNVASPDQAPTLQKDQHERSENYQLTTSTDQKTIVPPSKAKKPKTPSDLLDRIPIVGMDNLVHAVDQSERRFWTAILFLSLVATLYYLIPSIITFARYQIVLDVQQVQSTDPIAPFPNVFVCMNENLNITYLQNEVSNRMIMNSSRLALLAHRLNRTRARTILLTEAYMTSNPLYLDWVEDWPAGSQIFNEIIQMIAKDRSTDWKGYSSYHLNALYSCETLLHACSFNGVPFTCCPNDSPKFIAGSSGCYKINVSAAFPNRLDVSSDNGRKQLIFESHVDLRNYYYYQWKVDSPTLLLTYGDQLVTQFDSGDDNIPAGTVTFANVKVTRRRLLTNCTNRYQYDEDKHIGIHEELKDYIKEMVNPLNYSVQKCTQIRLFELLSKQCGCVIQYDTLNPNDSSICTPVHLYTCINFAFKKAVPIRIGKSAPKDVLQHLKDESVECLPLCDSWDYEAQYTFQPLGDSDADNIDVLSNKVVITLDEEYVQESDVYKLDTAAFLGLIGDSFGLFMGLSLVSLVQVVYWVAAAIALKRKMMKSNQANQVKKK